APLAMVAAVVASTRVIATPAPMATLESPAADPEAALDALAAEYAPTLTVPVAVTCTPFTIVVVTDAVAMITTAAAAAPTAPSDVFASGVVLVPVSLAPTLSATVSAWVRSATTWASTVEPPLGASVPEVDAVP